MKIAIISWHFPPINTIAAVRVGKMARYFDRNGHDIRVITSGVGSGDRSQAVEIDNSKIVESGWIDIDRIVHPISAYQKRRQDVRKNLSAMSPAVLDANISKSTLRNWVGSVYNHLFFFPDQFVGWIPRILKVAHALFNDWRPDLILASGPPFSGFIAASRLSQHYGIPWVAEFRDRWVDDPYRELPKWRRFPDAWLEKKILSSASGIVTVSLPWKEFYAEKYIKPTVLVLNGFDPEQFSKSFELSENFTGPVRILHMGSIYPGKRDPSPLFDAISKSNLRDNQIRVVFYGKNIKILRPLAEKFGVLSHVDFMGNVTYEKSIELQKEADVLLLLQWNNSREQGNIPAKIFEYFAVRRPILGIGLEDGVPSAMIRERHAGLFSNDPIEISKQLRVWVAEKKKLGNIALLPETVRKGLSRDKQYSILKDFLNKEIESSKKLISIKYRHKDSLISDILGSPKFELAREELLDKPTLCIIVDAEEEFNWRAKFARYDHGVLSMQQQYLAHKIYEKYNAKPTYLIDYPVAINTDAKRILKGYLEQDKCELGVQLHPWVNPPFDEKLNVKNSYLCNLSKELIERKLEVLTTTVSKSFDFQPTSFKAGRYGFDGICAGFLEEFGYEIDTSIVPHTSFKNDDGPSFRGMPDKTFWFGRDRKLLEVPVTRGYSGFLRSTSISNHVSSLIDSNQVFIRKLPGGFSRSGMLERITLTPEGVDHAAHRRLMKGLLKDGRKVFCLSYHSSSLLPGSTPYVRNDEELDVFLQRIDKFLDYFLNELGGRLATLTQVSSLLKKLG